MIANTEEDIYFFSLYKNNIISLINDTIIRTYNNSKLNTLLMSDGYHRVYYNDHSIQKHRLIWMIYNNTTIPNNMQINHINGIKCDNNISNLELVTNSQNTKHAYDVGLAKITNETKKKISIKVSGERNTNAKLTNVQVANLRVNFAKGIISIQEIQSQFDLSRRSVENMLLGRSYKDVPNSIKTINKYKLNKQIADEIRKLYEERVPSQNDLAKKFNVSRSTIKDVLNKKIYI